MKIGLPSVVRNNIAKKKISINANFFRWPKANPEYKHIE